MKKQKLFIKISHKDKKKELEMVEVFKDFINALSNLTGESIEILKLEKVKD